jgi:excisionase family DNA binding protein
MTERAKPCRALESESNNAPRLYTPAQAAEVLAVRESWLRRQAGQRTIPCTFVGKHLRFSIADLTAITQNGRRQARAPRRRSRKA